MDGNDFSEALAASQNAIQAIRDTSKPQFLEMITYRWRGHVGPKEDVDVGVRRSIEELEAWKKCDPIKRVVTAMVEKGYMKYQQYEELESNIRHKLQDEFAQAINDPLPDSALLYNHLYAK